jgi:hypothetical protein
MGPIQVVVQDGNNLVLEVTPTPNTTVILDRGIAGPPGPTGTGDVDGPASATDNALARFDGTTGKLIQNSVGILSDAGALTGLTAVDTTSLDATNINALDGTASFSIANTTGVMSIDDTKFTLQDNADTTKKAQFELSGNTTATTRIYTLPNLTGSLATIGTLTQTFSGTTTFSGATVTVGTSTATSTYGLGSGASIATATKTINIGTAGVSGSTTNINIGSAVAGATNNISINGPSTFFAGTANGVAYLNGSKVLTTGSALTFDGSVFGVAPATGVVAKTKQLVLNNFTGEGVGITFSRTSDDIEVNAIGTANSAWDMGLFARDNMIFATGGGSTYSATTERMRLDASGNLGIGTSSPGAKLEVNGNTRLSNGTGFTSANSLIRQLESVAGAANQFTVGSVGFLTGAFSDQGQIVFSTNNSLGNTERMRLDSSGNLGLGITPSAWNSAAKAMQISTAATFWGLNNNQAYVGSNSFYDAAGNFKYIVNDNATQYRQWQGVHAWFNAPSGTAGNAISFTQAMTLDASGNLGIGTSSPVGRLTVQGAAGTNGINQGIGLLYSNGTQFGALGLNNSSGWPQLMARAGAGLTFHVNSDLLTTGEAMRLDASGNLGLGVTPSAWVDDKALQLPQGSVSSGYEYGISVAAGAFRTASNVWNYTQSAAGVSRFNQVNGAYQWFTAPPGTAGNAITFTQAMTLDASGNLLVGNTSQILFTNKELNVNAASGSAGFALATAGTARLYMTGTSTEGNITTKGAIPLLFGINETEQLRLNASGQLETGIAGTAAAPSFTRTGDLNTGIFFPAADTIAFSEGGTEAARFDASANFQVRAGAVVVWSPAPAAISAAATLTNANIQAQIINTTGTSYTVTMPLGTTMETLVPWSAVNLGYDFTVINTASGTITIAVNTGVTSLGGLTIATGVSAVFRIRRTAANTFILYRLS